MHCRYYILGAIFGTAKTGSFSILQFIIFFSYQIVVHFLSVVAIVYVSSTASRESEKTARCVHKLLNCTNNEALKVQLAHFSMQLIHRKFKFTAGSLFNLDSKLLFTVRNFTSFFIRDNSSNLYHWQVIKALSTYVVILVQFNINQEAKIESARALNDFNTSQELWNSH